MIGARLIAASGDADTLVVSARSTDLRYCIVYIF
jgi:hypothetical protein